MSIYLETNVQPEAPCPGCNGSGEQYADRGGGCLEPDCCAECGGIGACGIGNALATLAHNLAITGALTEAYVRGRVDGIEDGRYLASVDQAMNGIDATSRDGGR